MAIRCGAPYESTRHKVPLDSTTRLRRTAVPICTTCLKLQKEKFVPSRFILDFHAICLWSAGCKTLPRDPKQLRRTSSGPDCGRWVLCDGEEIRTMTMNTWHFVGAAYPISGNVFCDLPNQMQCPSRVRTLGSLQASTAIWGTRPANEDGHFGICHAPTASQLRTWLH